TRIWDGISSSFDDWILAHLPRRVASAVDLGCGAGRHSILLADHAEAVLAVHHVGDPGIVLPHVRSLLAPGGRLIVADIIDPGGWPTHEFHLDRAFTDARVVYELTGNGEAAADTLRLLLHPRWLQLAQHDTPLSRVAFQAAYERAFPGAEFA